MEEGFLAFVESNMTGTGMQALRLAHDRGLGIAFLTSDLGKYDADPDAARTIRDLAGEIVTCDTNSPEALEKALRNLPGPVRGIMTVMEYFVPVVAATASRMGLPGLDPGAAAAARDKGRSRSVCHDHGVPVPRFRFVGALDQLDAALDEVGLPCVIKPVDESASIGVTLCRTREQAYERMRELAGSRTNSKGQPRTPGGLVEECLFGPEVSVETFSHGGRTVVLGVTDKLLGPVPHFVELGHTFPSGLPPERSRAAADVAVAALAALGFDYGPAHVEVKLTARGPVLIEVNARAGGDFVPDLVRHATGVGLLEQTIVASTGGTPQLRPSRHGGAAIRFLTGSTGVVAALPDTTVLEHFPSVVAFRVKAVPGQRTSPAANSHERLGYVLTSAGTAHEAALDADAAAAQLALTYEAS
ncbi:ATP-grasp domain-containing protein [Symbioplanes lichenis]|uniref:ATP-grasp domain-containing protein n=1 Tax=Symbioplanes lichenis TaxID=1629072 RepID=UPI0027390167|nr:ATP-grasp domain-containing protein [Actinoplanes lichenis]